MIEKELDEFFKQYFSFWNYLSLSEKQLLIKNTVPLHYPKGSFVHGGDKHCIGVLIIRQGHLRTYLLSEEGRDITLYHLFLGDVCILSASCILEAITFDVFIDAEENTDIFLINATVFHQMAQKNIYIKCFAYELAATRFSDVMWTMQQVLFMGADKRLAIFLWDEISRSHTDTICMTHEQIARYIGSAREVISRMLKYFEAERIINYSRGKIQVINKEKLNKLI